MPFDRPWSMPGPAPFAREAPAMIVTTAYVDLPAEMTPMRTFVVTPAGEGRFPGVLLFSDIFALTQPTLRAAIRFASYGFVTVVPEFYHRTEAAGTAIAFADRDRAFAAAEATSVTAFDADTRTVLDALALHPQVRPGAIGVTGFCIGGHLAVRAALQPDVRATAAFYPTGLHSDTLGGSSNVDTLARVRAGEVRGGVLLAFGASDPHVPLDAVTQIQAAFAASGSRYLIATYDGEHAFMRDEGPRWNASEADRAYHDATEFFRTTLGPVG